MRTLLFFACCVVAAASAHAQQPVPAPAPKVTVLFIGNSFTYGGSTKVHQYNSSNVTDEPPGEPGVGGIPAIFKKFADESGLRYEVHVETVGGKDLEFHYQRALHLIAQTKWDAVVLQGYSTEPLPASRGGKPESFLKHAALLEQAIHRVRPETKIYLYETWAYPFKAYSDAEGGHLAAIENMTLDLRAGYRRAFTEDKHFEAVAPVGDAWLQAIRAGFALDDASPMALAKPGLIDLWDTDNKHPSIAGSYLAALVLFQQLTGTDASKLGGDEQAARDLGISKLNAVRLQATAAQTFQTARTLAQ